MRISNSDPAEIHKFSVMAENWWDSAGFCKPLHDLNPVRLSFIQRHSPVLHEQKIIDIGCGGGLLSEALIRTGAWVTGVDQSEALIAVAKRHAKQNGLHIDYLVTDAETLAERQSGCFDIACCMELLEHVPDPQALIQTCGDLVKPGGWLFFSTINRNAYAYLAAIISAEYLLKLFPIGTHQYKKFIRPSEFAVAARKAGLTLHKLQGIRYNPLTRKASFTRQVSVNYLVALQKQA